VIARHNDIASATDRVLVVHAHPDDEVFATGAATISLAERGYRVSLRVGTGGEAGLLATCRQDPAQARAARAEQLTRSCALLGITDWDYLAEPGKWIDTRTAGEATLAEEDPAVLAAAVRSRIDELKPSIVLTVGRGGLTGHPDHIAIYNAVRGALAAPGWRPREAWGALLLHQHVTAAQALAAVVVPDQPIGSGRVRGHTANTVDHVIGCSNDGAHRRRAALDQYTPGLGTLAHDLLAHRLNRFGDSLLLRLAMDIADWRTDRFEAIPIRSAGDA
jgi:LmbE family N-acetylglucosaminyl deacetylase